MAYSAYIKDGQNIVPFPGGGGGGGSFTVQTDTRTGDLAAGVAYSVPPYSVGTGAIVVFLDGILCNAGVEYIEASATTITFTSDIPLDVEITVRVLS